MISSRRAMVLLICLTVFGLMAGAAQAALVEFSGMDPGATSTDPRPNSNGAAASFDAAAAALGPENIITFENAPLGPWPPFPPPNPPPPPLILGVAPGVTLTVPQNAFAIRAIVNANPYTPANGFFGYGPDSLFGYNTTVGGSKFLSLSGSQAVFAFSQPIQFFGAYITGAQPFGGAVDVIVIGFSDGTQTLVDIPMNPSGGADFVGFTDAGTQISTVSLNFPQDVVGVDDVRFGSAQAATVPEPATLIIWSLLGGLGISLGWRRLRKAA